MLFFLIHYLLFARPNHTVWKAEPRKREGKSCMAADPPPPPSRHHSPHARGFALTVLASATAKTLTSREQYRQLESLEQAILPFSAVSYQLADLCKAPNQSTSFPGSSLFLPERGAWERDCKPLTSQLTVHIKYR